MEPVDLSAREYEVGAQRFLGVKERSVLVGSQYILMFPKRVCSWKKSLSRLCSCSCCTVRLEICSGEHVRADERQTLPSRWPTGSRGHQYCPFYDWRSSRRACLLFGRPRENPGLSQGVPPPYKARQMSLKSAEALTAKELPRWFPFWQ